MHKKSLCVEKYGYKLDCISMKIIARSNPTLHFGLLLLLTSFELFLHERAPPLHFVPSPSHSRGGATLEIKM
jgi:hypothetical protein